MNDQSNNWVGQAARETEQFIRIGFKHRYKNKYVSRKSVMRCQLFINKFYFDINYKTVCVQ